MVQSPSGLWQRCPICEGTGKAFDPGIEFIYRMSPVTLAGNGQSSQIITILNWPFRWQMLTGEFTGAFTVFFTDLGTGRQFSNVPIHSTEIVGNAQNPFPLLVPYVIALKSSLQIDLVDVSGAPNTVGLALIGTQLQNS